jgi:catalase
MDKKLTTAFGVPIDDNRNIATAGKRRPALLQNKMAHFDREVISGRRMQATGSGAGATFTVTYNARKYTKAKTLSEISLNRESKEVGHEQVPR